TSARADAEGDSAQCGPDAKPADEGRPERGAGASCFLLGGAESQRVRLSGLTLSEYARLAAAFRRRLAAVGQNQATAKCTRLPGRHSERREVRPERGMCF